MLSATSKAALAASAGIAGAVGSALCCAGPLVAVALGVSGAGLATTFEPWRPWFVGGTVLSLGVGFLTVRREDAKACVPDTLCASPRARRRMKSSLWIATAVAAVLLSFEWWSPLVIK
jgi:mercuric ion transport protein